MALAPLEVSKDRVMNYELETIWKEAVMAYTTLRPNILGLTENNHTNTQSMTAGLLTEA